MKKLLVLASLLLASPALAVNDWGYSGCSSGNTVGNGQLVCFDINASLASPYTASFSVTSDAALACFRPDVTEAGVPSGTPATAEVWYCPAGGSTTATCGVQVSNIATDTLTGLNGVSVSQEACFVIGPGTYLVYFPTLPESSDVGLFSVQGAR